MSVICKKCGADISFESEEHSNCARVAQLAAALYELVDAVASVDTPWDLEVYGIRPYRAEEICELAEFGKNLEQGK